MRLIGFSKQSNVCLDGFIETYLDSRDKKQKRYAIKCLKCRLTHTESDLIVSNIFEKHLEAHKNMKHFEGVGEEQINVDKILENGKKWLSLSVAVEPQKPVKV